MCLREECGLGHNRNSSGNETSGMYILTICHLVTGDVIIPTQDLNWSCPSFCSIYRIIDDITK